MRIGFITCQASILNHFFPTSAEPHFISPEPLFTPDDFLAVQALRDRGHVVDGIVWGHEMQGYDAIIMRSPWDYMNDETNKQRFFKWLKALTHSNLPILNSPALMTWLLDKHYLQHFTEHDIATIPTEYLNAGTTLDLLKLFQQRGTFVLKQCISAAGTGLFYIDSETAARHSQSDFNVAIKDNDYMLQEFIPEIQTHGEWSLIFLGGEYSHSILKKPAANAMMVHAERGGSLHFPVSPSASVIAFGEKVYATLPKGYRILYMRVDVIETAKGCVLVECEGVEPELFFRAQEGSEQKFCDGLETSLREVTP